MNTSLHKIEPLPVRYSIALYCSMLRRLPPIVQFIFVSMIGIFIGTVAGLIHEFLQQPFSATNAVVWLFLMLISGAIITLVILYARNRFD